MRQYQTGWLIIISLMTLSCFTASAAFAQVPLTAEALIKSDFQKNHQKTLEKGEIFLASRPEEVSNTELNCS